MLVNGEGRCESCKIYRSVLRAMYSREKKCSPSSEKTKPTSHVNYRYLSTPEKHLRMANLRAELAQQKRKMMLLEEKVKGLTETSGVEVDEQMHSDLSGIIVEQLS